MAIIGYTNLMVAKFLPNGVIAPSAVRHDQPKRRRKGCKFMNQTEMPDIVFIQVTCDNQLYASVASGMSGSFYLRLDLHDQQVKELEARLVDCEKELVWNCSISDKIGEVREEIEGYIDGAPDAGLAAKLANKIDNILGQSISPEIIQKQLTTLRADSAQLREQLQKGVADNNRNIQIGLKQEAKLRAELEKEKKLGQEVHDYLVSCYNDHQYLSVLESVCWLQKEMNKSRDAETKSEIENNRLRAEKEKLKEEVIDWKQGADAEAHAHDEARKTITELHAELDKLKHTPIGNMGAENAKLRAENERFREALGFYANPESYHSVYVQPFRPCGGFADDTSDVGERGFRHGKKARQALTNSEK